MALHYHNFLKEKEFDRLTWVQLILTLKLSHKSYCQSGSRTSLDPRPNLRGRVWGETLPRSVLSAGMLPSVLMRERTSLQPTSVRVRLMTGSQYTVDNRNLENWSSAWPIALNLGIWKRKFADRIRETRHSSKTLPSKVILQTLLRGLGLGSRLVTYYNR